MMVWALAELNAAAITRPPKIVQDIKPFVIVFIAYTYFSVAR